MYARTAWLFRLATLGLDARCIATDFALPAMNDRCVPNIYTHLETRANDSILETDPFVEKSIFSFPRIVIFRCRLFQFDCKNMIVTWWLEFFHTINNFKLRSLFISDTSKIGYSIDIIIWKNCIYMLEFEYSSYLSHITCWTGIRLFNIIIISNNYAYFIQENLRSVNLRSNNGATERW